MIEIKRTAHTDLIRLIPVDWISDFHLDNYSLICDPPLELMDGNRKICASMLPNVQIPKAIKQ